MGLADFIWLAAILGGVSLMLYRLYWKKKSGCSGCDSSSSCGKKPQT